MNATAKFYTGVFIAIAIVVAVSFVIGYRVGFAHGLHAAALAHAHLQK